MNQNIIVTMPSKDLRKIARDALKGNWMFVIIGSIIYTAIAELPIYFLNFAFSSDFGSSLYTLLVSGALSFGYASFLLSFFRKTGADYGQLFSGFERFAKLLGLMLYISIFTALWSLLFIIPGVIASYRYSKAFMIMVDNPSLSASEALNESKRLMRGNVMKNFCLDLSFIGWQFLALIPSSIIASLLGASIVSSVGGAMGDVAGMGAEALIQTSLTGSKLLISELVLFVANLGLVAVSAYIQTANVALYDMMTGRLKEAPASGEWPLDPVSPPPAPTPGIFSQEAVYTRPENPEEYNYIPDMKEPTKQAQGETAEPAKEEAVEAEVIEIVEAEIVGEDKTEE